MSLDDFDDANRISVIRSQLNGSVFEHQVILQRCKIDLGATKLGARKQVNFKKGCKKAKVQQIKGATKQCSLFPGLEIGRAHV